MSDTLELGIHDTRAALAGALSTVTAQVDGQPVTVTGYLTTPPSIDAYDGWPVLTDVRPFTWCMAETDWNVYVALPAADQLTTVNAGDSLISAVVDALQTLGKVTHIRPMRWLVADGAEVPVWQFEVNI